MDRGDWRTTVHGVAKSRTRLSDWPFNFHFQTLHNYGRAKAVKFWKETGWRIREKSRQLVTLKAYEGELFGGWPDTAVGHQGRQLGRKAGDEAEENEQIGTYEGKLSVFHCI